MRKLCTFFLGFLCFAPLCLAEFTAPAYEGFVTDITGTTLTAAEKQSLEQTLQNYADTTQNEIAILIVDTTDGMVTADYATRVGNEWGIGKEGIDNGILMVAAMSDRDFFIATGSQTEGYLTDAKAGRIWREVIRPYFKSGDFGTGLAQGIEAVTLTLANRDFENLTSQTNNNAEGYDNYLVIFIFLFLGILMWLGSVLGRSKAIWPGALIGLIGGFVFSIFITGNLATIAFISIFISLLGLAFDAIVSSEYQTAKSSGRSPRWWGGGGGFGGGGSSGGGFGGFGGGGFSGGGAGGSW